MYAIDPGDKVYHLLTQTEGNTLCGLDVVPIVIDRLVDTSCIYLTSRKPTDRELCQECGIARAEPGQDE